VFSYLRTLTRWHCPHSPAAAVAVDLYLLPASPQQQTCSIGMRRKDGPNRTRAWTTWTRRGRSRRTPDRTVTMRAVPTIRVLADNSMWPWLKYTCSCNSLFRPNQPKHVLYFLKDAVGSVVRYVNNHFCILAVCDVSINVSNSLASIVSALNNTVPPHPPQRLWSYDLMALWPVTPWFLLRACFGKEHLWIRVACFYRTRCLSCRNVRELKGIFITKITTTTTTANNDNFG